MARSTINPVAFGIMGAAVGGMQFMLSDVVRRMQEEADLWKLRRLDEIRIAEEGRANQEWQRRNDIEVQDQQRRDELLFRQGMQQDERQNQFTLGRDAEQRSFEAGMEDRRTDNDMAINEQQAELQRQNIEHEEELRRTRPQPPGDQTGMYGTDGKFYPVGTPMPQGVTPTVGFGATNLGTRGTTASRAGQRPSFINDNRIGSSEQNPLPVASLEEAKRAAPGTWIRLPNGRVGQR